MKKFFKIIIVSFIALVSFTACNNNDSDYGVQNSVTVPFPGFEKLPSGSSFINAADVNATNLMYDVRIQSGIELVNSLDLFIEWTGDSDFAPVLIKGNILPSELPYSGSISGAQLTQYFPSISTLGLEPGQKFIIFAVTHSTDGKSYPTYTSLGAGMSSNDLSSGLIDYLPYLSYDVSCPSDLAGTYQFSTTNFFVPGGSVQTTPTIGSVTFTETAAGEYGISDASFGCWPFFYGETADGLKFKDVCNKISFIGASQYSDTFTISNIVVNGSNFSFHWVTSYGEYGDTTLTRTDGTNWPALY